MPRIEVISNDPNFKLEKLGEKEIDVGRNFKFVVRKSTLNEPLTCNSGGIAVWGIPDSVASNIIGLGTQEAVATINLRLQLSENLEAIQAEHRAQALTFPTIPFMHSARGHDYKVTAFPLASYTPNIEYFPAQGETENEVFVLVHPLSVDSLSANLPTIERDTIEKLQRTPCTLLIRNVQHLTVVYDKDALRVTDNVIDCGTLLDPENKHATHILNANRAVQWQVCALKTQAPPAPKKVIIVDSTVTTV